MIIKTCTKCKIGKPNSEFFKTGVHKSGKQKFRGDCKACASKDTSAWRLKNRAHYNSYMGDWRTKNPDKVRAVDMKRHYGLSVETYNSMLKSQNFVCKICGRTPKGKRPLVIDHCHNTKKVRGILCYRCNRAIALLDDISLFEKAIAYLKS